MKKFSDYVNETRVDKGIHQFVILVTVKDSKDLNSDEVQDDVLDRFPNRIGNLSVQDVRIVGGLVNKDGIHTKASSKDFDTAQKLMKV